MTRDAELYYLMYTDWKPIKEAIEAHAQSYMLSQEIVVFRHGFPESNCYAIISVDDRIDRIIEQNGGTKAAEKDLFRNTLKIRGIEKEVLYGDESLTAFIVPIP